MMRDLSSIVNEQSPLVDRIEDNISRTVDYTEKSFKELKHADQLQKDSTKKKGIILGITGSILAIFTGIIGYGIINK